MTYPVGSITGFIRIAGAAQAQQDLNRVRAGMVGAGESASAAAGAITRTEGALAASGRAASSASAGAAKYRAAQLSAVAATERYNAVLADEDASLARVASAEAAVIRANERLRATTPATVIAPVGPASETAAKGMGRFGTAMASAGKMAVGLGLTLGAFELAKKAIDIGKEAANFQREMLLVQTQAGASAAEVKSFSAAVLTMSGQVATAPDKLANSLYHAYSVGLRGAQALDAIKIAAEGAKVGNADLEQTTNALTAAVASGIPGVQNMQQAMGALNTIVGAGDMNLEQLNEALGSGILVVAKQFGVTLTDVGAALATFGDNNIRGAQAATTLRVSINAMAKPVAGGAEELAKLGLSASALADDMQHGGLNQALHDLKDHLDRAGITGSKVGDVLLTAFGKKAGPGVSVLVDQLSRFDQKTSEIEKGAGSFGDRWKATTQTASFAFQKLGAEVEAGGIVLATKLMPAVTSAAQWIGTNLPNALSTLADILGPIVKLVGTGLVDAWHAVSAILGPVLSALGSVGHFLAQNADAVRDATGLVLGLWAAYKGYMIAVTAFRAITVAMATYRAALISTSVASSGMAANLARFVSSGGPAAAAFIAVTAAVGALGFKISGWLEAGRSSVAVMFSLGGAAKSWKAALDAANGALDQNVLKSVAAQLQSDGLAKKAEAAGISLNDLTYGVTHGKQAYQDLVAAWKSGGKPSDDTIKAAGLMAAAFYGTRKGAQDLATVTGKLAKSQQVSATAMEHNASASRTAAATTNLVVDSSGNFVHSATAAAKASAAATTALQAQTTASKDLKLAEDLLNGVGQSLESTTDTLSIGIDNLRHKQGLATTANNRASTSLDQSTAAGATNRQMLLGLIQSAQAQAQATADQTYKTKGYSAAIVAGNAQLSANESRLRAAAYAAGFNKQQVDAMIGSLGRISQIHPNVVINTNFRDVIAQLDSIYSHIPSGTFHFNLSEDIQKHFADHAEGGLIRGPGTGTSDSIPARLSNGEFVVRASQAAKNIGLLNAINRGVPAFASGGRAATSSSAPAAVVSTPTVSAAMPPIVIQLELDGEVIARRTVRPEIAKSMDALGHAALYGYR